MQTGHNPRNNTKMIIFVSLFIFIIIFGFTMCIRMGSSQILSPKIIIHNMWTWISLTIAKALKLPLYLKKYELIENSPYYMETIARFRNLLITILCGGGLAVSGAVFQGLFRNPMAAPSMLGVTSGVNLGLLILVLKYSADAYMMIAERYIYCFTSALILLIIVIGCGKFAGKKRISVTDMLLTGAVFSQIVNVIIVFCRFNMDEIDLEVYQILSLYGFMANMTYDFASTSIIILFIIVLISLGPIHLMRFSFNAICFSDEEAYTLGINPKVVRVVFLLGITFLITSAVLYCGNVGIVSLVIPHICRYIFGSNFKHLYYGSAFYGALLLLVCRAISSLIYIDGYGSFPIGPLSGVIAAPILAVVLLQRRRGWE